MFHDPRLERTTNGTGLIHEQPWHGVLENVRTKKAPHQPIPLFTEVIDVLMTYPHVKLNVSSFSPRSVPLADCGPHGPGYRSTARSRTTQSVSST